MSIILPASKQNNVNIMNSTSAVAKANTARESKIIPTTAPMPNGTPSKMNITKYLMKSKRFLPRDLKILTRHTAVTVVRSGTPTNRKNKPMPSGIVM